MCKEIIGYKLKKGYKRYERIAMDIAECQGDIRDLQRFLLKEYWGEMLNKLKKAGVLELWFEPIYEEEKFKVGDWVKYIGESSTICKNGYIYKLEDIDSDGWVYHICDDGSRNGYSKKNYKLATKQEIEQHLIAEAKRRGFEANVKFKFKSWENEMIILDGEVYSSREFKLSNLDGYYRLSKGDGIIYSDKRGWSKIIKDEKIEVSGYKAKFDKVRKTVQFSCKTITLEELKAVLVVMELNEKFDYKFSISNNVIYTIGECGKYGEIRNGVTKETIQKLIKTLEDE